MRNGGSCGASFVPLSLSIFCKSGILKDAEYEKSWRQNRETKTCISIRSFLAFEGKLFTHFHTERTTCEDIAWFWTDARWTAKPRYARTASCARGYNVANLQNPPNALDNNTSSIIIHQKKNRKWNAFFLKASKPNQSAGVFVSRCSPVYFFARFSRPGI